MQIIDIKPSATVGKAYEFLIELRLEKGPIGKEAAKAELLTWWKGQN